MRSNPCSMPCPRHRRWPLFNSAPPCPPDPRQETEMLPELMLLGFAAWTLILLLTTVGAYRLSRVFRGRAGMSAFPADRVEGKDWYLRSMRAHANCVENL